MGSQRVGHDWETSLTYLLMLEHNKLWKIFKVMGIPDHLTCLLRNFYVRSRTNRTMDWLKIGRVVCQGRRQRQPTPVLLPGKSHGQRSLVGCSPCGRWESDKTDQLHFHFFTFMHWRRKWQPTPVFLPGGYQGWVSLVGFRLWGHTESDTTEAT